MKLNNNSLPKIRFSFKDELIHQKYGGELNFYSRGYEDFPIMHFDYIEELNDTIKILTDIFNMAMQDREYLEK